MSANIFPKKEFIDDIPFAESVVYDCLSDLSGNFTVFYSVRWAKRSKRRKTTWKENDFLILNPSLGALVLEVKGGNIRSDGSILIQKNKETGEEHLLSEAKRNDPLSQAIDGIYHYRQCLNELVPGLDDRFPIEVAIWMPGTDIKSSINKFPLGYREVSDAILGEKELDKGPQAIYDVFNAYNNREKVNLNSGEYEKILSMIASEFELIESKRFKSDEMNEAFIKLTSEQAGLLDYISEQKVATIQGAAGTGKTMIAKEAAKNFSDSGRKVLFLCVNAGLKQDLQKNYPYSNVTYLNIHSFINEFGNEEHRDLSNSEDRADELYKIDPDLLEFDDVIVDEGQDLLDEEIVYFSDYVKHKDGHYLVFYDKNQVVLTKEVSDWLLKSECKLVLSRNCRNTREIAVTTYNIINIDFSQKDKMVTGLKPTLSFVKGEPLIKLIKLIQYFTSAEQGYRPGDITILTLKTENESILGKVNKLGGLVISRERNNSTPYFTTAKKFKGLESRVVIVIDIDERSFSDKIARNDFYVACSRATQRLALFINGDEGTIKSISDSINRKPYSPEAKIMMKTKTELLELN